MKWVLFSDGTGLQNTHYIDQVGFMYDLIIYIFLIILLILNYSTINNAATVFSDTTASGWTMVNARSSYQITTSQSYSGSSSIQFTGSNQLWGSII